MDECLRIGTEVALSRNVICREKVVGEVTQALLNYQKELTWLTINEKS